MALDQKRHLPVIVMFVAHITRCPRRVGVCSLISLRSTLSTLQVREMSFSDGQRGQWDLIGDAYPACRVPEVMSSSELATAMWVGRVVITTFAHLITNNNCMHRMPSFPLLLFLEQSVPHCRNLHLLFPWASIRSLCVMFNW